MRPVQLFIAALVVGGSVAHASTILSRTTDQLFQDADTVATVQVGDVHAERSGGHITTIATLVVSESFKGAGNGTSLRVLIPGGVLGEWGQHVEGAPTLTSGENCVVFLSRYRSTYRFTGLEQGKLSIVTTGASAVLQRTTEARLVARGPDGQLHDSVIPPATEPLQPFLQHLRELARGSR